MQDEHTGATRIHLDRDRLWLVDRDGTLVFCILTRAKVRVHLLKSRDGIPAERGNKMSKKHFVSLADHIRLSGVAFNSAQLEVLASFCKSQNGAFMRDRWLAYLKGECGPSGGKK